MQLLQPICSFVFDFVFGRKCKGRWGNYPLWKLAQLSLDDTHVIYVFDSSHVKDCLSDSRLVILILLSWGGALTCIYYACAPLCTVIQWGLSSLSVLQQLKPNRQLFCEVQAWRQDLSELCAFWAIWDIEENFGFSSFNNFHPQASIFFCCCCANNMCHRNDALCFSSQLFYK